MLAFTMMEYFVYLHKIFVIYILYRNEIEKFLLGFELSERSELLY